MAAGCKDAGVTAPALREEPAVAVRIELGRDTASAYIGDSVMVNAVVRDGLGRALPGLPVSWRTSDSTVASIGTSGAIKARSAGTAQIVATSGKVSATLAVTVRKLADPSPDAPWTPNTGPGWPLEVRAISPLSAAARTALTDAVVRWKRVITGGTTAVRVNLEANTCADGMRPMAEVVQGLVIYVVIKPIDGRGKILGQAGPCIIRTPGGLPVVGGIVLDSADVAMMEEKGTLTDVVLHEMGHVLGIGTLWAHKGLVAAAGGTDPLFTGTKALGVFEQVIRGYLGEPIPLENTGGTGTRDSHWRETVFKNELMTGWVNANGNPMSTMTIASLGDLGYTVNGSSADFFSLTVGVTPSAVLAGAQLLSASEDLGGEERMLKPKFEVDATGRLRPHVLPPQEE